MGSHPRQSPPTLAPDIRTILQLGDWAMDPAADALLIDAGIDRVYVTVGNHEPFGRSPRC